MSLMKKDNETVRHFALRVQQLVKKGWCNENVKHVSTLLEPSILFHTLVRRVDSEDIAYEKIRTQP